MIGTGATDKDGNALDLTAVKKLVTNADYRGMWAQSEKKFHWCVRLLTSWSAENRFEENMRAILSKGSKGRGGKLLPHPFRFGCRFLFVQ